MLGKKKDIDAVFKTGLSGYEIAPEPYVWEALESGLAQQKAQRRTLIMWRSLAAACAIILLLVSFGMFFKVSEPTVLEQQRFSMADEPGESASSGLIIDDKVVNAKSNQPVSISENDGDKLAEQVIVQQMPKQEPNAILHEEEVGQVESVQLLAGKSEIAFNNDFNLAPELKIKRQNNYYPLFASAYEAPETSQKKRTLSIGGVVTPAYNSKVSSSSPAVRSASNSVTESGISSLGGGIQLRINTKSRWSFETGVLYAQVGQEVAGNKQSRSYDESLMNAQKSTSIEVVNSMGAVVPNNGRDNSLFYADGPGFIESTSFATVDNIKQTLDYIEIPMMARYSILNQFPYISISGGISSNFLVNNAAYALTDGSKEKIGETSDIKPFVLSSSIGVGVDVPLSKVIRLSLEPRLKYFINSVSANENYSFHPYSFGVYGGITFVIQ